ncbi:MAG: leucyl aminopeptidase family protein [Gammaproteobacteria bacterium]
MLSCFVTRHTKNTIPIKIISQTEYPNWLAKQTNFVKQWLSTNQFRGEPGNVSLIPDTTGKLQSVLFCDAELKNYWCIGNLPLTLPEGVYELDINTIDYQRLAITWGLGSYQFSRYKKPTRKPAQLFIPNDASPDYVNNIVESIYFVRDLINTPADDMGPSELADVVVDLGKTFKAKVKQIVGDELLKQNYPMIYAVGRACDDEPRLIDLRWGNKKNPQVTLVGKGVCFDTGGLDIKPSSAMLLMKKDMGGAAHVLGLARMIMQAELAINLRVLIPVVENSVSGNAYRPGDILQSRKGTTVEIGNTDAEGRLVLADALTEAVSEKPNLLIDISTLTGAARVALGTDLPALFANQDDIAHDAVRFGTLESDPMWRLPLYSPYRELLNSPFADINNVGMDSYGGAIIAGLFLKEFVPDEIPWMHFDLMAWNLKSRPGRPQGGEAMVLRALFSYLIERFEK